MTSCGPSSGRSWESRGTRERAEAAARELLRRGRAARATESLAEFIRRGWPVLEPGTPLVWNWHLDAICLHLEAASDGRIRRLLVNVPPGHMKSLIVSVFWPAWRWLREPGWRGLFSSYAMELAIRDSVRCRDLVRSDWYRETFRPEWELKGDQNVKSYFENSRRGFRFSMSVGGRATGFRGDTVVCDDPLNAKEQHSEAARKECLVWWDRVMSSRLNDQRTGTRVIIMQRLHEGDLAGHVLARGGYEHLCLPTEWEPERKDASRDGIPGVTGIGWRDPRREPGELLFPALFPAAVVEEAKRDLGARDFAGQHQQRPAPAGGALFQRHWWRFYTRRPERLEETVQSWDMAFKDTDGSDFVVGQVWGRAGADKYLLDQVRARLDFPATVQAVLALSEKWPGARKKLVEDKANGPAVIAALKGKLAGLVPVLPEGGKEARAHAVSPEIEAGNVYLPAPEPDPETGYRPPEWIGAFLEEAAAFPHGAHDDQVDAMTQALNRLAGGRSRKVVTW